MTLLDDSCFSPSFYTKPLNKLTNEERAPKTVKAVQMYAMSDEEVRRISVLEVTALPLYEKGTTKNNSLLDKRLGTCDSKQRCNRCYNDMIDCTGHFGHIELPLPICHMSYIKQIVKILRGVCHSCYGFVLLKNSTFLEKAKQLSNKNRFLFLTKHTKTKRKCPHCNHEIPTIKQSAYSIVRTFSKKTTSSPNFSPTLLEPLTPRNIKHFFRQVSDETYQQLGLNPKLSHPANFVLETLIVPPVIVRPTITFSLSTKMKGQDDLTTQLQEILKIVNQMKNMLADYPFLDPSSPYAQGSRKFEDETSTMEEHDNDDEEQEAEAEEKQQSKKRRNNGITKRSNKRGKILTVSELHKKFQGLYEMLQQLCANYFNNESVKVKTSATKRSGLPRKSLMQRLKGKRGRFRGNVTGKRVDHCARMPISGDPHLHPSYIGVSSSIVRVNTFPEYVTKFNLKLLQDRVNLGFNHDKGAHSITINNNTRNVKTISLQYVTKPPILEIGWIVHRYIQDGDSVLFNRQPSLRKKSIMAHKIKILPWKTFRLPYPCTTPYNADCDGDEMNMHFLQTVEAKVDSKLMTVSEQLLNAQNCKPILGAVQDTTVVAYSLSRDDVLLSRSEFMQLMMTLENADSKAFVLPIPAILKPEPFWTGKQAFSLILPHISMNYDEVKIRDGELLTGCLCKRTLGPSSNGIIHIITQLLNSDAALDFIHSLQKLTNAYGDMQGLSIGLDDCATKPAVLEEIQQYLQNVELNINELHTLGSTLRVPIHQLESSTTQILNRVLATTAGIVQKSLRPNNALNLMITSQSKGSTFNIAQISGCVSQQSVDGSRIYNKDQEKERTLACFDYNDTSIHSRGFVTGNYWTGLSPAQSYFHNFAYSSLIQSAKALSEYQITFFLFYFFDFFVRFYCLAHKVCIYVCIYIFLLLNFFWLHAYCKYLYLMECIYLHQLHDAMLIGNESASHTQQLFLT